MTKDRLAALKAVCCIGPSSCLCFCCTGLPKSEMHEIDVKKFYRLLNQEYI